MYVLNKNELRVFNAICEGADSIAEIRDAADTSAASAYRAVSSLTSSRLVERQRSGKRIRLAPSHHGHSKALCAYLKGNHRSIDPIVGSRLLVLLSISSNPKRMRRLAEEVRHTPESARRIVWDLKRFGAVSQERDKVSIPPSDTVLGRFLRDFSKGACEAVLETIEPTGTVVWSEGLEFVFAASKVVNARGVSETGITAMARRGLQLVSNTMYHHRAYWRPRLRKEDIAIHQILIDPNSTRNISYGLLFLMKEGYSRMYLEGLGDALGIQTLARQIDVCLSGGSVENPHFPSRAEMAELRAQYGVG